MTQSHGNTGEKVLVANDIAKQRNAVLIQYPASSPLRNTQLFTHEIYSPASFHRA